MDDLNYNVAVNLKRIRREKGMSLEGEWLNRPG